jgi:hypothetical protein
MDKLCAKKLIYENALAIYELDDDHRGLRPTDPERISTLSAVQTFAKSIDICTDISCYKNKKFINDYANNLILPKEDNAAPSGYNNTLYGDYKNNIIFMRCLDMLLYNSISFIELKPLYYDKTFSIKPRIGSNKFRSSHLYKGIKPYLIQQYLDDDNKIKETQKEIILPYYNSTSTNIYKSFLYAHKWPYSGAKTNTDYGHVFIINNNNINAKCVDYVETFDKSKTGYKLLSHFQILHGKQYESDKKYVYEQEILFNRFSKFTNITYIGTIKEIIYDNTQIATTYAVLNPGELILDTKSKLYYNKGIYSETHFYNIFGQIHNANTLDLFNNAIKFDTKLNLDILESDIHNLDKFIGTRVYNCDLEDCDYTEDIARENNILIPNDMTDCAQVIKNPELKKLPEFKKLPGVVTRCRDDGFKLGGSNLIDYYQKYLKYKNKYLELKKINI